MRAPAELLGKIKTPPGMRPRSAPTQGEHKGIVVRMNRPTFKVAGDAAD
jgi:hypothetical protein